MSSEYVHHFYADNGMQIRIRPMTRRDAPYLVALFERLSPDSRYQRFNLPLEQPEASWVQQQADAIAALPPARGRGWLAFAALPDEGYTIVAGIRYVYLNDDSAEIALSVRDDLQGLGIGSGLIAFAGSRAYAAGIRTLVGYAQRSNKGLWASLERLRVPVERFSDGPMTRIEVDLRQADLFHHRPDQIDRHRRES